MTAQMQAFAISSGTLLQGEYRLIDRIGSLSSSVFRARRSSDGRIVAIRLWRGADQPADALELARAASRIRHPTIALVEASGQLDDGTCFIVSEHVAGIHLDAWADVAGIAPLPSVIDLVYRVCAGLNAAHRNGLSHSALHARNFILRETSTGGATLRLDVKLLDLGVPAFMHVWPPPLHAAHFMAPEQLKAVLPPVAGAPSEATPLMNVYSCGALLYSLCTGGPPYPSKSLEELCAAHAARRLVPPSRINPQVIPALDSIVLTALDPDPQHRFATTSQLASALVGIRFERSLSGVRPRVPSPTGVTQEIELDGIQLDHHGFDERPTSESVAPDLAAVRSPSTRPSRAPALRATLPPPKLRASQPVVDEVASADPITMVPDRPEPRRRPPPQGPERALWIAAAAACVVGVLLLIHLAQDEQVDLTQRDTIAPAPAAQSLPPSSELAPSVAPVGAHAAPMPIVPEPRAAEPDVKPEAELTSSKRASDLRGVRSSSKPRQPSRPSSLDPLDVEESPTLLVRPQPAPAPTVDTSAREPSPALPLPLAVEGERASDPPAQEDPPAERPAATTPSAHVEPRPTPKEPRAAPLKLLDEARIFDLSVKGSLPTSQVRRGVDRIQREQRACYRAAKASARPNELNEVTVEVEIDERGRARTARVTGAAPASLKRCVQSAAQRLSVLPPDTGTVVATWKVSVLP